MTKVLINEYSDLPDKTILKSGSKENVSRGPTYFPLKYYMNNTVDPHYDLPIHYHSEFELIHIISGNYKMICNTKEYELKKDDLFLITSNQLHGDSKKSSALYESVVFDIGMIRLHSYEPDVFINHILNKSVVLDGYISSEEKECVQTAVNLFEIVKDADAAYETIVSGLLLVLFGFIQRQKLYTEPNVMPEHKQRLIEQIDNVILMIRDNYQNEVSLDSMAQEANLSSKYFCRIFKDITKKSPIEYLNWYRINRACSQLRETEKKIPDIAEECGFNDLSYFIKIFKKFKGTTPLKYRHVTRGSRN